MSGALQDLAKRLAEATGPDRELDAAIAVATTPTIKTDDDLTYARLRDPGNDASHPGHYFIKSRSGASARTAPSFTASIDAALTLIPDEWEWVFGKGITRPEEPPYGMTIFTPGSGRSVEIPPHLAEAEGGSQAIVICIAALKARAALAKATQP